MLSSRLTLLPLPLLLAAAALAPGEARAHCQIPCGIYDDAMRIEQMLEDTLTIEKAVKQIQALAGKGDAQSVNQATRWVVNKEDHASRIIEVVSAYFLTQKLKVPDAKDQKAMRRYHEALADHHAVMVAAMKAKQTVDPGNVRALRAAVEGLRKHWGGGEKKK